MAASTSSRSSSHAFWLALALFSTASLLPAVVGKYTPFLDQSFFFAWTPPGQTVPIPTTAQCETIHISWSRGSATGPSPVSPYFLQIYTSTFIVPFTIPTGNTLQYDLPIPWEPGTQYQICMFDSNGATGGCQDTYTIYPSLSNGSASCTNVTYPATTLGIIANVEGGWSQYGWVPQCTDIQLRPTNGTPPYTYTIAPALHPPAVIKSNDMSAVNWTVSLSWGTPFFVSVVDANGVGWQNGPIHSGSGDPSCLSQTSEESAAKKTVSPAVAIGSGVGGLIVGAILGALIAFGFLWWRRRRSGRPDAVGKGSRIDVGGSPHRPIYHDLPSDNSRDGLMRDTGYHIEPFTGNEFGARGGAAGVPPQNTVGTSGDSDTVIGGYGSRPQTGRSRSATGQGGSTRNASVTVPTIPPPPSSVISDPASPGGSRQSHGASHVYVVHHDGGRAPVTVYTADGTEVVELPPRYPADSGPPPQQAPQPEPAPPSEITSVSSGSGGDSNVGGQRSGVRPLPRPWEQSRQAGPTPSKGPHRTVAS